MNRKKIFISFVAYRDSAEAVPMGALLFDESAEALASASVTMSTPQLRAA